MAVWVIKGGRAGQYEDAFLEKGVVCLGFGLRQSIADFADRDALRAAAESRNGADQMWRFYQEVGAGDLVALPRKRTRQVAVGHFNGPYDYRPEAVGSGVPHVRGVAWQVTDIPRSHFDRDLLNSFGSQLTFSQPGAPNPETRIARIVADYLGDRRAGEPDAVAPIPTEGPDDEPAVTDNFNTDNLNEEIDIDREIRDRIIARLRRKFAGARLEHLVASILQTSGYVVAQTRKGADGGIDVLAGKGDMGFGAPRLCVQVKGRVSPVDLAEYDRLRGNIANFHAQHGLLVSLGGFTKPVHDRNEQQFFEIRLWGPDELTQKLLENYDAMPPDIRADIPLRDLKVLDETDE